MPSLWSYALVFGVAIAVTAAACGPAAWISRKVGYVALPSERKIHTKTTPYGGGAAMFLGFCAAMVVAAVLHPLGSVFVASSEPLGVVLAAAAIFGVGLVDDVRDMSPPAKIAGQVLAASILYFLGVTLYWVKLPFGTFISLTPSITPLIMALWVIALANAVNIIDGLDGLAAGIVAIGGGALAIYGLRLMAIGVLSHTNIGPLVAVVACGICVGFLPFNFHPAKMFMGDAGALLLGLLMSASTMVIGGRIPPAAGASPVTGVTYFFFAPLFIPFFILGVPLVDMAFAFMRRTARGTGFHRPDKDHIHHRLLRLGHGHRRSVVILWAWTAILSGFILFPLFVQAVNPFIPLGVALLAVALFTWFHPEVRHRPEAAAAVPVLAGEPPDGRGAPGGAAASPGGAAPSGNEAGGTATAHGGGGEPEAAGMGSGANGNVGPNGNLGPNGSPGHGHRREGAHRARPPGQSGRSSDRFADGRGPAR